VPNKFANIARRALGRLDRAWYPEAHTASEQWQRVVMDRAVDRHLLSLDVARCTAAEISGDAQMYRPWKSFTALNYPAFDLCAPLTDPTTYDVIICEQVLEHVIDPWAAAANLKRLCAPGGHVVVTSPFLIKVHELQAWGLRDYWRFTPRGLRTLLESAGLRVETVGHWGNRQCVYGNLDRWSAYRRWHSLGNRADTPVQVWAFARNQQDGDLS
jgi:SAM-dependent methyltransferase